MSLFRFLFISVWTFLTSSVFAAGGIPVLTENAMRLTLNKEGFQTLSQSLRNTALKDIENQPVEDFEENLGSGVRGTFSGIRFSVNFRDLRMIPVQDGFIVDIDIDQIDISIDRVRFYKKIGLVLSTTCHDTEVMAGGASPLHLGMQLEPRVTNGLIELKTQEVTLALANDQFKVKGPRKCSGDLGVGNIISFAINKALINARKTISQKVELAVRESAPSIAHTINGLFESRFPVTIGGSLGMPATRLLIAVKPYAVDVNAERAVFPLTVDLSPDSIQTLSRYHPDQYSFVPAPDIKAIVGALGVRAALLNDVMGQVLPRLPHAFDIDLKQNPILGEVFSRQGLSMILPDLNSIELDDEIIYARLGLGQAPILSTHGGPNGEAALSLRIPDLHLMLEVKQNGQRLPYFNLVFDLRFSVSVALIGESLKLTPIPDASVLVNGSWADGYTPHVEIFEGDVAQMVFSRALDVLGGAGPLTRFDVPPLRIDPETVLRVSRTHVENEFFGVDFHVSSSVR